VNDPFNLERFVHAQDPVLEEVCSELRRGEKAGHWMWFVFPQIKGLGHSETTRFYAISSRNEAEAYLSHPVLGPRLRECTRRVIEVEGRSIAEIFRYPDNLKFMSSMTLFAHIAAENQLFHDALNKYFGGQFDDRTLQLLRKT
jgi:uncharacterized protein (DUF1810 family)